MLLAQPLGVDGRDAHAAEQPAGVAELLVVAQHLGRERRAFVRAPAAAERAARDGDQHLRDEPAAAGVAQLTGKELQLGSRRVPASMIVCASLTRSMAASSGLSCGIGERTLDLVGPVDRLVALRAGLADEGEVVGGAVGLP